MAQVRSLKLLCFCFFSVAPAENVYPKLCITSLCSLLCEAKKCPIFRCFKVCISAGCGIISLMITRDCGQSILTKEEWKQKEQKRKNGQLFYQTASPAYGFPLVAERIVPPRYVFYIALCLSPTVFCTSSCREYKHCRLFSLSSSKTYESNKPCQP